MEKFSILRPFEDGASCGAPPLPVLGKGCLLDTMSLPMHSRTCRSVMGLLVGNAKATNRPASRHYFGFNVNFNDVPWGNANALHIHRTLEYFVAYSGDFAIHAGDGGRASVKLNKWDLVVIPPWVKRYFRCDATGEQLHVCPEMQEPEAGGGPGLCALILAGVAGDAWVQWSRETVVEARHNGVRCTDAGVLLDDRADPPAEEPLARELDCSQEELEACVHRAGDRPRVVVPHGDGDMRFEYVDVLPGDAGAWSPEVARSYCAFVLEGPAVVVEGPGTDSCGGTLSAMEVLIVPRGRHWSLSLPDAAERGALVLAISSSITAASFPPDFVKQLIGTQMKGGG